jgi:hypothetical protein
VPASRAKRDPLGTAGGPDRSTGSETDMAAHPSTAETPSRMRRAAGAAPPPDAI